MSPVSVSSRAGHGELDRVRMAVVIAGHVDHGKSSIVGRLLADTGSLPVGKLEQVRAVCNREGKPFEYAFLVDALQEERAQGITIDAARVFFKTDARDYVLLDAPGHVEFLKNMVTGAARAEAAVLVVDAREGVMESSRKHAAMLSLLDVRQMVVLVNKMDAVSYDEARFHEVVRELAAFLETQGLRPSAYIPVSAREGDNLAARSPAMTWYAGPTFLGELDAFNVEPEADKAPFRMPVQDVYKFAARGDERRIVAGTIDAGTVHVGDELVFQPSGKRAHVASIEAFGEATRTVAEAGRATGFTLREPVYVARGELATRAGEPEPVVGSRFEASLFWLGRAPLREGREYVLKLGTARTIARVEKVVRVIDAASLSSVEKPEVRRNEVAECVLSLRDPIACDLASSSARTSRFVLVDAYTIAGGGIIRAALPRAETTRARSLGTISLEMRRLRFGHRAALVVLTGDAPERCRAVAQALEQRVFASGGNPFALDLEEGAPRERVSEIADTARAMLDAGTLVFLAAPALSASEVETLARAAGDGEHGEHDVVFASTRRDALDLPVPTLLLAEDAAESVLAHLDRTGVLPRNNAAVVWFTGLSGAGKSTIAARVARELSRRGVKVEHLDGDSVRDIFPLTGFTKKDRDEHVKRIGYLASRLERHGVVVIASFVSPFADARNFARNLSQNFIEVHVATPLEECERRDPKGLYVRARKGEIREFTGIDSPYEAPENPELRIDTAALDPDAAAALVIRRVLGADRDDAKDHR